MRTIPVVTSKSVPTLSQLKEKYSDTITATENDKRVMAWKEQLPDHQKIVHDVGEELKPLIETDEEYPQCNYCVGGALQMAFDIKQPHDIEDWSAGIFPDVDELAETIHYVFRIPYANDDDVENNVYLPSHGYTSTNTDFKCWIKPPLDGGCVTSDLSEPTAYAVAKSIIEFNDTREFDLAWKVVGKLIDKRKV